MRGIMTNGADQKSRPIPDKKTPKVTLHRREMRWEGGRRSICCVGRVSCEVGSEQGRKWTTQITTREGGGEKRNGHAICRLNSSSVARPLEGNEKNAKKTVGIDATILFLGCLCEMSYLSRMDESNARESVEREEDIFLHPPRSPTE